MSDFIKNAKRIVIGLMLILAILAAVWAIVAFATAGYTLSAISAGGVLFGVLLVGISATGYLHEHERKAATA